jgi:hypothetical protein
MTTTVHMQLPGRVSLFAPDPKTFLRAVPPSHRSCVRGWSLIPFEERIFPLFERSTTQVPGWYTVSKRGMYRGDLGYATFFDENSAELHLLVAPRRLKPRKRPAEGEDIGQDYNTPRRLFSPDEHAGHPCPPYHGNSCYQYNQNIFVCGLLLLKLKINQVDHALPPSPHQIALHVTSMVNPPFMMATQRKFNQRFWKEGDCVTITDATHHDTRGRLVCMEGDNDSAVVRLYDDSEYAFALSSLRRLHSVGDVVRVVEDPFSNNQNLYHGVMGWSGMITYVDPLVGEITVTEPRDLTSVSILFCFHMNSPQRYILQFQVPEFLLESHTPDQAVYAPVGVLAPTRANNVDSVQVNDAVEVISGTYTFKRGYVIQVNRLAGILTFTSSDESDHGHKYDVAISVVDFMPDHRALKFTPERGFNVAPGDFVVAVRGDYIGKGGVVTRVCLDQEVLDIASNANSNVSQLDSSLS